MNRPLCPICKKRHVSINYYDKEKNVHYRSMCSVCNRAKKNLKPSKPRWLKSGYKKKKICDKCGFHSIYKEQIVVFHLDGNLNNTEISNLRSICLNCVIEVQKDELPWKQGDLIADF